MKIKFLELDLSILPLFYKLKGVNGKYELYILKAVGRGVQLIKPDRIMLQLLEQN
jgi:hypothetical protein